MKNLTADQYAAILKSFGLNSAQLQILIFAMADAYMDGWTDGNANKQIDTEHKQRITSDLKNSWTMLIIDGFCDSNIKELLEQTENEK